MCVRPATGQSRASYMDSPLVHVYPMMSQDIDNMFLIFNLKGLNMKKYIVTLTKDERGTLSALTSLGKHKS